MDNRDKPILAVNPVISAEEIEKLRREIILTSL